MMIDIDKLWAQATHEAIQNGEMYTRHRFAALIVEECAARCDELVVSGAYPDEFAAAIRQLVKESK